MGYVFAILGWLCVALGIGYAVLLYMNSAGQGNSVALLVATLPAVGVTITGFLFLAISAGLGLLSQIEHNTGYAADALDRLAGGDERKRR